MKGIKDFKLTEKAEGRAVYTGTLTEDTAIKLGLNSAWTWNIEVYCYDTRRLIYAIQLVPIDDSLHIRDPEGTDLSTLKELAGIDLWDEIFITSKEV